MRSPRRYRKNYRTTAAKRADRHRSEQKEKQFTKKVVNGRRVIFVLDESTQTVLVALQKGVPQYVRTMPKRHPDWRLLGSFRGGAVEYKSTARQIWADRIRPGWYQLGPTMVAYLKGRFGIELTVGVVEATDHECVQTAD